MDDASDAWNRMMRMRMMRLVRMMRLMRMVGTVHDAVHAWLPSAAAVSLAGVQPDRQPLCCSPSPSPSLSLSAPPRRHALQWLHQQGVWLQSISDPTAIDFGPYCQIKSTQSASQYNFFSLAAAWTSRAPCGACLPPSPPSPPSLPHHSLTAVSVRVAS